LAIVTGAGGLIVGFGMSFAHTKELALPASANRHNPMDMAVRIPLLISL